MLNDKGINGTEQMKSLIDDITELDGLTFDFLNGVLSSRTLGDYKLWLSWGEIKIISKENRFKSKKRGELPTLYSWHVNKENLEIIIFTSEKEELDYISAMAEKRIM